MPRFLGASSFCCVCLEGRDRQCNLKITGRRYEATVTAITAWITEEELDIHPSISYFILLCYVCWRTRDKCKFKIPGRRYEGSLAAITIWITEEELDTHSSISYSILLCCVYLEDLRDKCEVKISGRCYEGSLSAISAWLIMKKKKKTWYLPHSSLVHGYLKSWFVVGHRGWDRQIQSQK